LSRRRRVSWSAYPALAQRTGIRRTITSQGGTIMKRGTIRQILASWLGLVLLLAAAVGAQDAPPKPSDPELERVQGLIRQAWQESDEFIKAGGKTSAAAHPNRKWAATLWQYRGEHPGTPAAARATSEALHLLVHADQISDMQAKADTLKYDDPAWKQVINVLMEAAGNQRDYAYVIRKTQALAEQAADPEIKLRARFTLGQAHWKKGETERAKAIFQALTAEHPSTPQAREAEGNLLEMELLNLGQPAPLFANRTISGERLALADFKGKVVLLDFWATWCNVCVGELPLLKELYAKHKDQGLAIIGLSLDDDPQALQEMVTGKGIAWPQIRDGKDGQLAKLFNVKGTPTYYLLDREGKIAAKSVPARKLGSLLAELLKQ
jgi:peroxiredoxin